MANTLLLRMPAAGSDETEWLLLDEAGERAGPRQRGPLSLAGAIAQKHRLVVLVPATEVMLTEPELPPGSGAKLARAVPFALEEWVTDDIDTLHFAIGRRGAHNTTSVAVVAKSLMDQWQATLQAAGLRPAAMYADASLLPQNPGQSVLWLEGGRLSLRRTGGPPVTVEVSPIEEALTMTGVISDPAAILADTEATEPALPEVSQPESVLLYCTPEDWARVQDDFSRLHERFASLNAQLLPEGPLLWLGRQLPHTDATNLLQGGYVANESHGQQWRRWRVAALLAATLLGTHIAAESLALHRANKQNSELRASIEQVFSQAMPGEAMHDPRRQMQARLAQIHGAAAGPQHFLKSLRSLADAMANRANAHVEALSYRDSTLDLKIIAPNVGELAQLSQNISRDGLTAELQSSTPGTGGVEGRMQIRETRARRP